MDFEDPPELKAKRKDRLEQIDPFQPGRKKSVYNPRYSKFIRWMRLVLPLSALAIAAVVFTWSSINDDDMLQAQKDSKAPKTIGKNELLNPRFESRDDKNQPYTITAARALQDPANEDLVILEKPLADMLLNSGNWIAIEAARGNFRQESQKLVLQGDVKLFHDDGYQMTMELLNVDINKRTAATDVNVAGQGPAGTLEAKGLQANGATGQLIFNGPVRLVLKQDAKSSVFGDIQ